MAGIWNKLFGRGKKGGKSSDVDPPAKERSSSAVDVPQGARPHSSSAPDPYNPQQGHVHYDTVLRYGRPTESPESFTQQQHLQQEPFNERSVDAEPHKSQDLVDSGEHSRDASSLTRAKKKVYYAVDRDRADWLLEAAVRFVSDEGDIQLELTYDVEHSRPLVVFCKNDSKLQEDIDNAYKRNRGGKDVMLVVVTDRKDQILKDTKVAKAFGQKVCLFWDHSKDKFRCSENYDAMIWIRDFLKQFSIKANVKFTRTDSLRRSWKDFRTGSASGFYHVLSQRMEEEALKNVVVHFDKQLVELHKATEPFQRSLILFCDAADDPQRAVATFMREYEFAKSDLVVVVLCPVSKLPIYREDSHLPMFHRLRMNDFRPLLSEKASSENRKVALAIKRYLNRNRTKDDDRDAEESQSASGHTRHSTREVASESRVEYARMTSGSDQDALSDDQSLSQASAMSQNDSHSAQASYGRRQTGAAYHEYPNNNPPSSSHTDQQQHGDYEIRGAVGHPSNVDHSSGYDFNPNAFHQFHARTVEPAEHHRHTDFLQQRPDIYGQRRPEQFQSTHYNQETPYKEQYRHGGSDRDRFSGTRGNHRHAQDMHNRANVPMDMDIDDLHHYNGVQETWQEQRQPHPARDTQSMANTDGRRPEGVVRPTGSGRRKPRQRSRLPQDQGWRDDTKSLPAHLQSYS